MWSFFFKEARFSFFIWRWQNFNRASPTVFSNPANAPLVKAILMVKPRVYTRAWILET